MICVAAMLLPISLLRTHLAYSSWSRRVMMAVRSDHRSPSVSAPTASSSPAIAAYRSSSAFRGVALRGKIEVDLVVNTELNLS